VEEKTGRADSKQTGPYETSEHLGHQKIRITQVWRDFKSRAGKKDECRVKRVQRRGKEGGERRRYPSDAEGGA
jgi:hypothetical protein